MLSTILYLLELATPIQLAFFACPLPHLFLTPHGQDNQSPLSQMNT